MAVFVEYLKDIGIGLGIGLACCFILCWAIAVIAISANAIQTSILEAKQEKKEKQSMLP
jgi:hypothetical protein